MESWNNILRLGKIWTVIKVTCTLCRFISKGTLSTGKGTLSTGKGTLLTGKGTVFTDKGTLLRNFGEMNSSIK